MLEMARRSLGTGPIKWHQARAEALPFEAGSLGAVVSSFAFHWFEAQAALSEFYRVLEPGGWALLVVPSVPESPPQALGNRLLRALLKHMLSRGARSSPLGAMGTRKAALQVRAEAAGFRIQGVQRAQMEEAFEDVEAWWSALQSRGSLEACFGAQGAPDLTSFCRRSSGPVTMQWQVQQLVLLKPAV
jgi:ubiquinone/menaquinone biosynthesis C-methylase UbiE